MRRPSPEGPEPRPPAQSLARLFLRFLRFGVLAFGGPVAQIAMVRRELVDEQGWISSARFNRLLAVMQVLPGPEAHELCVHLGIRARGRLGGLLAGLGFMLPGLVLMLLLSWAYFAVGVDRAGLGPAFLGVQAAVLALIVRAVHGIGRHILVDPLLWLLAAGAGALTLFGASFWIVLPTVGVIHALARTGRRRLAAAAAAGGVGLALAALLLGGPQGAPAGLDPGLAAAVGPGQAAPLLLFLSGLKAGLLTFGGAYTAIPFVRGDAVGRGWLSDGQFLDGLALSGVLPAPLIIFATFVGYAAGGFPGALAITAGVFLPAFAFSMIFYDRLERLVDAPGLRALLDGVAAGVVGLIAATTLQLGAAAVEATPAPLVSLAAFAAALAALYLWRARLAVPAVLAGAGLVGALTLA